MHARTRGPLSNYHPATAYEIFVVDDSLASTAAGFNNHRLGLFALLLKKKRLSNGSDRERESGRVGLKYPGVGRKLRVDEVYFIGSSEMVHGSFVLFFFFFSFFSLNTNFLNCRRCP